MTCIKQLQLLLTFAFLCVVPGVRSTRSATAPPSPQRAPLLDTLRTILRNRSPAIDDVAILEIRSARLQDRRRAALVWGVRHDHVFHGSLADELFGVFVVDDSLTKVLRTVDLIPTPRWLDFAMRIERVTSDSIYVRGQGATYGDQPFGRTYVW